MRWDEIIEKLIAVVGIGLMFALLLSTCNTIFTKPHQPPAPSAWKV